MSASEFEPSDWEALLYLRKALHPYECKWENYVQKVTQRIHDGLVKYDYFRMAYQARPRIALNNNISPLAVVNLATFLRNDYVDRNGKLDRSKIENAAAHFCIKQMKILQ